MQKKVICFLDDNVSILNLLETFFESHQKFIFYGTDNAQNFLEFITNNKIDIVFIDIELGSNISGIDIAEKVKKLNNQVPIIAMTGWVLKDEIEFFDDILTKPVGLNELEKYINSKTK